MRKCAQPVRALVCGRRARRLNFHHLVHLNTSLIITITSIIKLLLMVIVASSIDTTDPVQAISLWVWQFHHFTSVFARSPVYNTVVYLCVRFLDSSACKTGHSLVLYYCDYRHYDLCWRQALQHSMVETWNCDSGFFGTGSQGGNYWEEEWPSSLPHQYSSERMCSSIRCLFLHCSVVWQCCKQQQPNLNRCNTACLLAGLTNLFITPRYMHAL